MKILRLIHFLSPVNWLEHLGVRPAMQVAIGLALLTGCSVLLAKTFNLIPSDDEAMLSKRTVLAETVALNAASLIKVDAKADLQLFPPSILERYRDIQSIALRRQDGSVLVATPGHENYWHGKHDETNSLTHIQVPLFEGEKAWGRAEICFVPPSVSQLFLGLDSRTLARLAFIPLAALLLFWLYLHRVLKVLDPSSAIPERLQMLLDTMVEGVVILDSHGQIIVVNEAFADFAFRPGSKLLGTDLSELSWKAYEGDGKPDYFPWDSAIQNNLAQRGVRLWLQVGADQSKLFLVNASPIRRDDGTCQGTLATFSLMLGHEEDKEILGEIESITAADVKVREIQDYVDAAMPRQGVSSLEAPIKGKK